MASITIKAVGSSWNAAHPKQNYSSRTSYKDFYSYGYDGEMTRDNYQLYSEGYLGFGFKSPGSNIIRYKKINSIRFNTNGLTTYEGDYRFEYRQTKTPITSADIIYSYDNNRFSRITYENRDQYKSLGRVGAGSVQSGKNLTLEHVKFCVTSWLSGRLVGSSDYKCKITGPDQWGGFAFVSHGYDVSDAPTLVINYSDVKPVVTPIYPVEGANVSKGNTLAISWTYSETGSTSGLSSGQKSYTLTLISPDGTEETYTETTPNQYKAFPPNSLTEGAYSYRVKVTSNDGVESNETTGTFNVVADALFGISLYSIEMKCYPVLTWKAFHQLAVDVTISDLKGNVVYGPVLVTNSDVEKHIEITKNDDEYITVCQLPAMLSSGNYRVSVRLTTDNDDSVYYDGIDFPYHNYSESEVLPTDEEYIAVTNDFRTDISRALFFSPVRKSFMMRRNKSTNQEELIAILSENNFRSYYDYTACLNTMYEYFIRYMELDYSGYTDSQVYDVRIDSDGIVIRDKKDPGNYVLVNKNKDIFEVIQRNNLSNNLKSCLGRRYPVLDIGKWVNEVRTIDGYVSNEDYKKLVDMALNSAEIFYQGDKESFSALINVDHISDYVGRDGVFVRITLTRLNEDKINYFA